MGIPVSGLPWQARRGTVMRHHYGLHGNGLELPITNFYDQEDMEQPVYQCMTKGSDQESGSPRRSVNWVVSRRGQFKVYQDRVELGNWSIPFAQIERATEYRIPYLPFIRASVLELQADGKTYQFGFNPWARPMKYFPIPVEQRKASMRYSAFSMIVRVVLLSYLGYILWDWLT